MQQKKRSVLATILAACVLAGLCGCSTSQQSSGSAPAAQSPAAEASSQAGTPAEPVEISFMHDEAQEERLKSLQEIIDGFMAENSGIIVTQEPVAEDQFETKVKTLVSAGDLPAMITYGIPLMQFLDEEEIINTQANREVVDSIGADNFYKGILDLINSQDGAGMTCVPVSAWSSGIWYRKDIFAEKGLNPPEKWEDILAAAKALHDPANKMYGIMFGTAEATITQQHFQQIALSNGAELFDESGQPQFTSPAMKEALQFYKELYQYSAPGSNEVAQTRDTLISGNTAMGMFSTYILSPLYNAGMSDKIGYAIPERTQKATFGTASAYTISNTITPAETEAAKRYISYLLRDEVNIKLLHMAPGGPNPVLKSVTADPAYTDVELLKAYGDIATAIPAGFDDLRVFGVQDGVTNPKVGSILNANIIAKAINQILVQGADLDATMEKAQQEMLDIVNS